MKKLTTTFAILFAVTAFAQKPASPPAINIDSIYKLIPDSVEFVSKSHINEAYRRLDNQLKTLEEKLTVAQFKKLSEGIDAAFGELINLATEDYIKRKNRVK